MAKYVRYVDDFALFSDDWSFLAEARLAVEDYLAKLRLKIHPVKSQLFETKHGASFLGFRIFPNCIRVRSTNLRRARRRLRRLEKDYTHCRISEQQVTRSLQSWFAHLEHGDTWQLRQQIFASLTWVRG